MNNYSLVEINLINLNRDFTAKIKLQFKKFVPPFCYNNITSYDFFILHIVINEQHTKKFDCTCFYSFIREYKQNVKSSQGDDWKKGNFSKFLTRNLINIII